MAALSLQQVVAIFDGASVPKVALEFAGVDFPEKTEAQLIAAIELLRDVEADPRLTRALTIAKREYAAPGKTFEETFPPDVGQKILVSIGKALVAVFRDLDRQPAG